MATQGSVAAIWPVWMDTETCAAYLDLSVKAVREMRLNGIFPQKAMTTIPGMQGVRYHRPLIDDWMHGKEGITGHSRPRADVVLPQVDRRTRLPGKHRVSRRHQGQSGERAPVGGQPGGGDSGGEPRVEADGADVRDVLDGDVPARLHGPETRSA
jgi:hypothetical protein